MRQRHKFKNNSNHSVSGNYHVYYEVGWKWMLENIMLHVSFSYWDKISHFLIQLRSYCGIFFYYTNWSVLIKLKPKQEGWSFTIGIQKRTDLFQMVFFPLQKPIKPGRMIDVVKKHAPRWPKPRQIENIHFVCCRLYCQAIFSTLFSAKKNISNKIWFLIW